MKADRGRVSGLSDARRKPNLIKLTGAAIPAMRANSDGRLMTPRHAAQYCGLSIATFQRVCPVRRLSLSANGRTLRFDRAALGQWIDGLGSSTPSTSSGDWLDLLTP